MKKIIKYQRETMNENPKCHLHIPQPRKGIYVMNIIAQNIFEKRKNERKDPKGTPKILMPLAWVQKPNGSKNPESNPEGNQTTHLWS